jgi:hypothetical protein
LDKDLQGLQKQTHQLIEQDSQLKKLFELITSIDGIGPVTATELIQSTKAFTDGRSTKRMDRYDTLACFAGVAPFPGPADDVSIGSDQSGSSIRGRSKVSPLADMYMKKLLHLSAMGVVRTPGQLQDCLVRL